VEPNPRLLVPAPHILEPGGTEVQTAAGGARIYRKPFRSLRWCDIKQLFAESFQAWSRHNAPRLGASLAFYSLLSLTPLLLIVVAIGGLAFGEKAAESQLVSQIEALVGSQGALGIQAVLHGTRNTTHGVIATIFGLLTLWFGASGVLVELHDALNTIWDIPTPQTAGLRSILHMLRERLLSFALVLALGFLLLVSLVVNAGIAALGALFNGMLPISETDLHLINAALSFVVITALFGAIYKVVPDVRLAWRDVLIGAVVTSFLFTLGKFLIGLYLGKASFASTYGAAASVVILIVWVYYSAQIFFLGAELTKSFTDRYGSHLGQGLEPSVVCDVEQWERRANSPGLS
jgi:membrane protein